MIEFLHRLFCVCSHKWIVVREGPIIDEDRDRIGTYFYMQCEKCGNIKYLKK